MLPGSTRRRPRRRAALALLAGALVVGLSACGAGSPTPPDWVPKPSFQGDGGGNGGAPGTGTAPPTAPASPGAPSSSAPSSGGEDPNVLAKNLTAPVGLTMMADGTALVGERTTGRIVQVQPEPGQPVVEVKTVTGIDASGDGGLLDIALSPTYGEDRLIYAYITTATDNRVVSFTLTGPPAPVFTGIPKGATGNTGRITFGPDGDLYIGTGDAGQPTLAANPASLAGKVLQVNSVGQPVGPSPVFSTGHHEVDGLCSTDSGGMLEVESGGSGDEVNLLGAGQNYGWPTPQTGSVAPVQTAPAGLGGFGGCAVAGAQLYVTSADGTDLLGAPLTGSPVTPTVGTLVSEKVTKYGRLKTVVAATDGSLWLTTTNKDGKGKPSADDERVIRIVPQLGGADSPV